ncbi:MAG: hypothetical protein AAF696_32600, partial [Bacteroidota bacterium]
GPQIAALVFYLYLATPYVNLLAPYQYGSANTLFTPMPDDYTWIPIAQSRGRKASKFPVFTSILPLFT